jgi:hypothetical protein
MIYYKWLDFKNSILTNLVKRKKGLVCGRNLIIRGKPIIDIRDGAKITIGDNVTLNS